MYAVFKIHFYKPILLGVPDGSQLTLNAEVEF